VEWKAKQALLEGYRERGGLDWDSRKLALIDLQWADLRAGKGLAAALMARGSVDALASPGAVERAMVTPPQDTRAWTRGKSITRFPEAVVAANWDSLSLALECLPQVQRVGLPDPWAATAAQTDGLFDDGARVQELIKSLRGLA